MPVEYRFCIPFSQILNDFMFTGPVDVTSKYHYDINDTFLFMFGYHSLNHPEPAYTGQCAASRGQK